MSLLTSHQIHERPQTRRELRRSRRALREQDRRSVRLAQLHESQEVLAGAVQVVDHGWIQHGWFRYVDEEGRCRTVVGWSPRLAHAVRHESVVAACLVGAIVQASGGPACARSPVAQRAIDLTWHASYRQLDEPFRWLPSPAERAYRLVDLVHWNDQPGRAPDQVTALLGQAHHVAVVEGERIRVAGAGGTPPTGTPSPRW